MALKFTPLEFETCYDARLLSLKQLLKFTPLEFETTKIENHFYKNQVKIYSVGV